MKNLRRAVSFFRPDTLQICAVLGLLISSIGLNVVKPWPMAWIVDCILQGKPFPSWVPSTWLAGLREHPLPVLVLGMLALHLGHALISAIQNYLSIGIGLRGLERIRNEVFGWLQRLSMRFHHGTEAGDIIFRTGNDTCAFQTLLQQGVFVSVSALLTLIMMTWVMWRLNARLTCIALIALPPLLLTVRLFTREMRSRGTVAQQAESKVYTLIHQGIHALPLIQSYTRENLEQKRFAVATQKAQRKKMSQHGLEVLYWLCISILLILQTAVLTWFGTRQVLDGKLTIGELLVFLAYLGQMFEPLNQLSMVGSTISNASASIQRVFEILDADDEVKDDPSARPAVNGQTFEDRKTNPITPLPVYGNITYNQVSFGYQDSRLVLRNVSFALRAGQSIAIIGPSGAGKSTLLNLLPRFFDPLTGSIELEGEDLKTIRVKDLRAQIALVLQEPIILPTTVAENIGYGRKGATLDEIVSAAEAANAHAFITRLPMQYRSLIGEGGVRLSVGERQRINLARAFLKNAPILLMDEPTSALDVESESQVVESLAELMRGRTSLIVAHRLTTIQRVHQVIVVEQGVIRECGTPSDLMALKGYYWRAMSEQLKSNQLIPEPA